MQLNVALALPVYLLSVFKDYVGLFGASNKLSSPSCSGKCEIGYYSTAGSVKCTACPSGYTTSALASASVNDCFPIPTTTPQSELFFFDPANKKTFYPFVIGGSLILLIAFYFLHRKLNQKNEPTESAQPVSGQKSGESGDKISKISEIVTGKYAQTYPHRRNNTVIRIVIPE